MNAYDLIIKDRAGLPLSVWYFELRGRVLRVYWAETGPADIQEKWFPIPKAVQP